MWGGGTRSASVEIGFASLAVSSSILPTHRLRSVLPQKLSADLPGLRLIWAPLHVERAREIQRGLEQLGLRAAIRSNVSDASAADCLIIDSTGGLPHWYGVADVVFIGKSIAAIGGKTPVEPVAAGKPVI